MGMLRAVLYTNRVKIGYTASLILIGTDTNAILYIGSRFFMLFRSVVISSLNTNHYP